MIGEQSLIPYGWDNFFQRAHAEYLAAAQNPVDAVGRVVAEHKSEYALISTAGEIRAELSGKSRYQIQQGEKTRPAVGDWIEVVVKPGMDKAIVQDVLPRRTKFSRAAAGKTTAEQIVAANVDVVLLVTSLNRDLNTKRLDRYLTLAWESGAKPAVILSKADLIEDREPIVKMVQERFSGVDIHVISSFTGMGVQALDRYFESHQTVALLGSSGVGKSTLINRWLGDETLDTQGLRNDDKGRHTTTHRQLFLLEAGGVVVDTPGMRELALWDGDEGLSDAFSDVEAIAQSCRFADCTHNSEPGCEVKAAILDMRLNHDRYLSYLKLRKELAKQEAIREARALTLKKRKGKRSKEGRSGKRKR